MTADEQSLDCFLKIQSLFFPSKDEFLLHLNLIKACHNKWFKCLISIFPIEFFSVKKGFIIMCIMISGFHLFVSLLCPAQLSF